MISFLVAWFVTGALCGALWARMAIFRTQSVPSEDITISRGRVGFVHIRFQKFGYRYEFTRADADQIGESLLRVATLRQVPK